MSPIEGGRAEQREYLGFQNSEVTTSAWLKRPEEVFAIVDELNKGIPKEQRHGIEIYPMYFPLPGITERITPEKVAKWLKRYPNAQVDRVHLNFNYDWQELFWRAFGNSKESLGRRYKRVADMVGTGPATNNNGLHLARELTYIQDRPVGVNVHSNVLAGFVKERRLGELREGGVSPVLVENEHPFNSPRLTPEQISNPLVIKEEMVKRYNLDGMLLGIDHLATEGRDPFPILEQTADVVRAVHVADRMHRVLDFEDPQTRKLFDGLSKIRFSNPLSCAIDYSVSSLHGMTKAQRFDTVKRFFEVIDYYKSGT